MIAKYSITIKWVRFGQTNNFFAVISLDIRFRIMLKLTVESWVMNALMNWPNKVVKCIEMDCGVNFISSFKQPYDWY